MRISVDENIIIRKNYNCETSSWLIPDLSVSMEIENKYVV